MIVHKCDVCGQEISTAKKRIFGFGDVKVLLRGKVKCEQWDLASKLFENSDICERCAEGLSAKLDYAFLKLKQDRRTEKCTESQ